MGLQLMSAIYKSLIYFYCPFQETKITTNKEQLISDGSMTLFKKGHNQIKGFQDRVCVWFYLRETDYIVIVI